MGLDHIRWLDSDCCVLCLCVCGRPRQEPCVCECGHCSNLKHVDFDLHAHLYCAQFMEDRNLLRLRQDSLQLSGAQLQYGRETWFHPFHSYPECGREPCSHAFRWYLYPQDVIRLAVDRICRFRLSLLARYCVHPA